jgi:GeoRSP system SPASM domain protein
MSLDTLDAPLRITWEICPPGRTILNEPELLQVAERLLEAGVFFLLLENQPLLHPALPAILKQLAAGGCQVSLVLGDHPDELAQLQKLDRRYPLFVDASCWMERPEGLPGLEAYFTKLTSAGETPSLLWVPTSGQLQNLYPLFALCERLSIPRFKLPNHKITVNSGSVVTAGLLRPEDLEMLRRMLNQQPLKTAKTALEVHDLFLWELIFPKGGGERSEYGGCQAGNSLGHIAVNADVWPCSSWPQVIGNLLSQDLHSIWESAARSDLRAEIATEPAACDGCSDYPICFGGCRGLSRTCHAGDIRPDLLCSGPRK